MPSKIGVLKNFANFTQRTPMLESLFNKITGLKAQNFSKKRSNTGALMLNLLNFLEHLFLQNTSGGCFQKWKDISSSFHFFITMLQLHFLCLINFHSIIFQYPSEQLFHILVLLFYLHTESKILAFINTSRRPDMLTRKAFNEKHVIKDIYFT